MTTPSTTTTMKEDCHNKWSQKKCRNYKKKGKCFKANVKENCELTCGQCEPTCFDNWNTKWCKKIAKREKCGNVGAQNNCKKSCGFC